MFATLEGRGLRGWLAIEPVHQDYMNTWYGDVLTEIVALRDCFHHWNREEPPDAPDYAWVLEVRPGHEGKYKRRHDEIWPRDLAALRAAGIQQLQHLPPRPSRSSAIFETDDLRRARKPSSPTTAVNAEMGRNGWDRQMKVEVDLRHRLPVPI